MNKLYVNTAYRVRDSAQRSVSTRPEKRQADLAFRNSIIATRSFICCLCCVCCVFLWSHSTRHLDSSAQSSESLRNETYYILLLLAQPVAAASFPLFLTSRINYSNVAFVGIDWRWKRRRRCRDYWLTVTPEKENRAPRRRKAKEPWITLVNAAGRAMKIVSQSRSASRATTSKPDIFPLIFIEGKKKRREKKNIINET